MTRVPNCNPLKFLREYILDIGDGGTSLYVVLRSSFFLPALLALCECDQKLDPSIVVLVKQVNFIFS